ncbi:hypothetical protein QE152_g6249 [Popillia japonica]|uniref:Uncharacterized protein n=1 Tax=Popillia japonica TaxID=7064 RepID=A0AAW1MFU2_POPJA
MKLVNLLFRGSRRILQQITLALMKMLQLKIQAMMSPRSNWKSKIMSNDGYEEGDLDEPARKTTNEDTSKAFQSIRHRLQYLENVPENIFNALNK